MVKIEDSVSKAVSHFTLEVVQPRVISFEEQVGCIRQHLADIYEREHNWRQAAQVLVGIPLETGQKQYSVDYKLETYLKIARLCTYSSHVFTNPEFSICNWFVFFCY